MMIHHHLLEASNLRDAKMEAGGRLVINHYCLKANNTDLGS